MPLGSTLGSAITSRVCQHTSFDLQCLAKGEQIVDDKDGFGWRVHVARDLRLGTRVHRSLPHP